MEIDRRVDADRVAVKTLVLAACVACLAPARLAHGQSIVAEAAVTGGFSTDEVAAAAAQFRVFGGVKGGIRFFGETAWARRWKSDEESDSFGAAYPYTNRVQIIEAYGERMFRPGKALVGLRGGRFRTPFGIYNGSDHAYSGFLRAPLIRYEQYSPLSNNFLEHGVDLVAGIPQLTIETALGAPADVGAAVRRSGLDAMMRLQGYYGPFIVGASHIRTSPSKSARVAPGRADVTGVDVRWMYNGVQLRGEWLTGRPFDGTQTTGWYADVLVHRRGMGPLTAVARVEKLDYEDAEEKQDESLHRQTVGARVRLTNALSLNVNVLHLTGADHAYRPTALDVGLTWSARKQ
jgi:hypothetical protein